MVHIQIGDEKQLVKLFKEPRGSFYFFGEEICDEVGAYMMVDMAHIASFSVISMGVSRKELTIFLQRM